MTIKLAASNLVFSDCNQAPYADRRKKKKKAKWCTFKETVIL